MFDEFSFKIVEPGGGGGGGGVPNGGTTGQVLTKESNADGDANWETPSVGTVTGTFTEFAVTVADSSTSLISLPSLGTTSKVLHGNASDYPDWDYVNLATDITGNLSVNNLDSGNNANQFTFWRGDGQWVQAGGGSGLGSSNTQISFNFCHNSNFQVREQSSIDLTTTPQLIANRWWAIAPSDGEFRAEIIADDSARYLSIHRYAGSSTDNVRLFQVFDSIDSVLIPSNIALSFWFRGVQDHTVSPYTSYAFLGSTIYSGNGINESFSDLLAAAWTDESVLFSFGEERGTDDRLDYIRWQFAASLLGPVEMIAKQLAIEIQIGFPETPNYTTDKIKLRNVLLTDYQSPNIAFELLPDYKSIAIVKTECNRYAQTFDAYLTLIPQTFKIDMRAIPTISFSIGDSAAFTTTGTTKDTLIISVDNIGDVGIHTIHLNAEL